MQELINYLRAIANDSLADNPGYSLCYIVSNKFSEHKRTFSKALYVAAKQWEHFTGDFDYPVPHPKEFPATAYKQCNKYTGEYGVRRRELAGLIAAELVKCDPSLY